MPRRPLSKRLQVRVNVHHVDSSACTVLLRSHLSPMYWTDGLGISNVIVWTSGRDPRWSRLIHCSPTFVDQYWIEHPLLPLYHENGTCFIANSPERIYLILYLIHTIAPRDAASSSTATSQRLSKWLIFAISLTNWSTVTLTSFESNGEEAFHGFVVEQDATQDR